MVRKLGHSELSDQSERIERFYRLGYIQELNTIWIIWIYNCIDWSGCCCGRRTEFNKLHRFPDNTIFPFTFFSIIVNWIICFKM